MLLDGLTTFNHDRLRRWSLSWSYNSVQCLYWRPCNVNQPKRLHGEQSINVINDLRLRDRWAFVSLSRSMITSNPESMLRCPYWKMDRKATCCHSLANNHMSKVMKRKLSAGDVKAEVVRFAALLCARHWFYISHLYCNCFYSLANTRFLQWIWPIFSRCLCHPAS